MRRSLVVVVLLLVAGCVSPAWDDHDYGLKAGATADSAASTVELVRRAVTGQDHLTRPYLKILLTEAARDLGNVNDQFGGVQPPTEASEEVRTQVTDLTSEAEDEVQTLLNQVRRDGIEDPAQETAKLRDLGAKLRAFAESHK